MINKVILLGHAGKDAELRHLDNDRSVARFTLATSESYKNKSGEKVTNTEWHNVVCWRSLAEIAGKYIKKGSMLYVEGKIRTRSWDDKDGNKRYTTEIEADNIQLVGRRPEDAGQQQGSAPAYNQPESNIAPDANTGFDYSQGTNSNATDDLPF
jgi:single-strand DNA-binding protein